jgi:hypothetical protein
MKTNINFASYLVHFFLEWEVFHTTLLEKINTCDLSSITFFLFENRALYKITWKTFRASQATDDNTIHVHCMLDK